MKPISVRFDKYHETIDELMKNIMTDDCKRPCPICKNIEHSVFMKDDAYNNRDNVTLLRCSICKFVYSRFVSIDYKKYGKSSSKRLPEELQKLSESQNISDLVSDIIGSSGVMQGRVLDFGCGIGLLLRELRDRGFATTGIEESSVFRSMLRKEGITSVSGLNDLIEQKQKFDLVIIKDVVEHLDQPLEIISALTSFIKPGGFLYIRVPNRYAYPFHWAVDTKGHVNHFIPGEIKKILDNEGLVFHQYIRVHDVSSRVGKFYNFIFWKMRYVLPMTHQISLLYKSSV